MSCVGLGVERDPKAYLATGGKGLHLRLPQETKVGNRLHILIHRKIIVIVSPSRAKDEEFALLDGFTREVVEVGPRELAQNRDILHLLLLQLLPSVRHPSRTVGVRRNMTPGRKKSSRLGALNRQPIPLNRRGKLIIWT